MWKTAWCRQPNQNSKRKEKKKRIFRNEESLRDNIKHTSICITEFPEDKREKGQKPFSKK